MKRLVAVMGLLVMATLISSCDQTWNISDEGILNDYKPDQDSFMVIRDSASWSFFYRWAKFNTEEFDGSVPSVDFSQEVAAITVLSERPDAGYFVSTIRVQWTPQNTTVFVEEGSVGEDVDSVSTWPYSMARVSAVQGSVHFVKDDGTPVVGVERDLASLLNEEFPLGRNFSVPGVEAPEVQIESLEAEMCPLDGTQLEVVEIYPDVTLEFSGLADEVTPLQNWGAYCPNHGEYWVKQEDEFNGWLAYYGPFQPGVYSETP